MTDRAAITAASELLQSAVDRRVFPAAVAEVGSSSAVLWQQAFGTLTFDPGAPDSDIDTIFDLASLTKPMATTTVVLSLEDRGRLRLDDRLSALFPEWTGPDRAGVTVQDLLEHTSGLSARLMERPPRDRRAFEHEICAIRLEYQPRTKSIYSDLGFILLAFCCEQQGDAGFASLVTDLLTAAVAHDPASEGGADLLAEVPVDARRRTAPTEPLQEDERRGRRLIGEVHDNYAAHLGGISGHAGLFATAPGVGAFARVVLRGARGDRHLRAPFTPAHIGRATTRSAVPGSSRALGWDTMLPTSSCGSHLSSAAFGHVGYTGTSLWIDPQTDRYFVLLSNRVCGGGTSEEIQDVRRAFHDALAAV
jgi:CubicO group peptidase (beta-lactamase class C family)